MDQVTSLSDTLILAGVISLEAECEERLAYGIKISVNFYVRVIAVKWKTKHKSSLKEKAKGDRAISVHIGTCVIVIMPLTDHVSHKA